MEVRLTEAGTKGEELVAGDGGREVGDGQAHVIASRLMKTEDVAVAVWGVVERCDEVLEGGAGVVRQLGKENLGLFFCERAHLDFLLRYMCEGVVDESDRPLRIAMLDGYFGSIPMSR